MAEIIEYKQQSAALTTPMEMLAIAVEGGADVAVLEKLMTLQERWEACQGRAAFDRAMADAKAQIKPIIKTTDGYGYKYEDLGAIASHVDPILAKNGLSYRFRTDQKDGSIRVTCIIAHRDGHFEETSLESKPDTGAGRNAIQAIGSAVTYLQRYTLKAALGLSATKDDDGNLAGNRETPSVESQPSAPPPPPAPPRAAKAQSRDLYSELQTGLRACSSKTELQAWGAGNRDRIRSLPVDWEQSIRDEYRAELEGHIALEQSENGE